MTDMHPLRALLPLLNCPDDGGGLHYEQEALVCERCHRPFPVMEGCVADLLPSSPSWLDRKIFGPEYVTHYEREFARPFELMEAAAPWGAPEALSLIERRRKQREVALVKSALGPSGARTVCDLTGGAGHYTRALAGNSRYVLHCDLQLDSLVYTARQARAEGITNMAFLRIDYLRLPFRASLDCVLCMDTLIRGPAHEVALIDSIRRAIRPGGTAVLDFHNWWHNPLRRIGLMPENFRECQSYSRGEAERLLDGCGVGTRRYIGFRQETSRAVQWMLPATRHVFVVREPGALPDSARNDSLCQIA